MAGITISGGLVISGVFLGDGGGPGPGPGPGPVLAGKLFSWGSANVGQTGQDTTITKSSPTQVGADTTWLSLATGYTSAGVKSSISPMLNDRSMNLSSNSTIFSAMA